MRLYIVDETEKAYKLSSVSFKERCIPKSAVTIKKDSERLGMYGTSVEMTIELWALK